VKEVKLSTEIETEKKVRERETKEDDYVTETV
jgi:hypothetical protein